MSAEEKNKPKDNKPEKRQKEHPREIRYIPIEYLPEEDDSEGGIRIDEIILKVWDHRRLISKVVLIFFILGFFNAFFSQKEYESDAIFMLEQHQDQNLLQGLSGAFGISGNIRTEQSSDRISPNLYPRIVSSLGFQAELMDIPVTFQNYGVTATIPEFYEHHYSKPLTEYAKDYTIGLPRKIIGLGLDTLRWFRGLFIRSGDDGTSVNGTDDETLMVEVEFGLSSDNDVLEFTRAELNRMRNLDNRISVEVGNSLLTVNTRLPDPRAAAEMNQAVIRLLKEYVTAYRIEKARQNLEFIEELHADAKERFQHSQEELASFQDRNIRLTTASAQTELERLQDEKNLAMNLYNSISQRLEQAKMNLQEETPVFNELQRSSVPLGYSEPNRPFVITYYIILGLFLSLGWIFIGEYCKNFYYSNIKGRSQMNSDV